MLSAPSRSLLSDWSEGAVMSPYASNQGSLHSAIHGRSSEPDMNRLVFVVQLRTAQLSNYTTLYNTRHTWGAPRSGVHVATRHRPPYSMMCGNTCGQCTTHGVLAGTHVGDAGAPCVRTARWAARAQVTAHRCRGTSRR